MPPHAFPPSDHCDGTHFFNPGGDPPRGFQQVLKWRLSGQRTAWPPQPPNPKFPPPPTIASPDDIQVTFIGHATFLLGFAGLTILTDPIFSDRCSPLSWLGPKRARPPGLALADLPPIDLVLLSHNHYDHLDLPTLRHLSQHGAPPVITLLGNRRTILDSGLTSIEELDWWNSTTHRGLRITATPARHFSARTPFDRNRALWGGFMLEHNGKRLFFAGDSGAGPHWTAIRDRLGPPDLALLPIGAYDPRWLMAPVHMNPAEAIQAFHDLGAAFAIGMHFGTFQLTDEPIDEPERLLRAAIDPAKFTTLQVGETQNL
jgi:L-ascorbate metabolism protein UlaG (beta-lactamase superfamily)